MNKLKDFYLLPFVLPTLLVGHSKEIEFFKKKSYFCKVNRFHIFHNTHLEADDTIYTTSVLAVFPHPRPTPSFLLFFFLILIFTMAWLFKNLDLAGKKYP